MRSAKIVPALEGRKKFRRYFITIRRTNLDKTDVFEVCRMENQDQRSPDRRARDEHIAAQSRLAPLDLPPGATTEPVEVHLARNGRRPLAVAGIVENGLVRPLDSSVKLTEHSRVIIVAPRNPDGRLLGSRNSPRSSFV